MCEEYQQKIHSLTKDFQQGQRNIRIQVRDKERKRRKLTLKLHVKKVHLLFISRGPDHVGLEQKFFVFLSFCLLSFFFFWGGGQRREIQNHTLRETNKTKPRCMLAMFTVNVLLHQQCYIDLDDTGNWRNNH